MLSAMVSMSDHPGNYESRQFHLLSLGVFVRLGKIKVVYFTGHQLSSTPHQELLVEVPACLWHHPV